MRTSIVTPPSDPLVTTAATKKYLGLYADLDDQDEEVADGVADATAYVERETSRAFASRTLDTSWDATSYRWDGSLRMPVAPVASVVEVASLDADGAETIVDPAAYRVVVGTPGEVRFKALSAWPAGGYRVRYVAGWADVEAVPSQARRAVKLLAANWFETRRPIITGTIVSDLPFGVPQLIGQLRWGNYPQ